MKIINQNNKISVAELQEMTQKMFGNLVKAVVDVQKKIMAVDGEFHSDEEVLLMENGSKRSDVWGINFYPAFYGQEDFIEFDSMINLKPFVGNRTRNIDDSKTKEEILKIVNNLIIRSKDE